MLSFEPVIGMRSAKIHSRSQRGEQAIDKHEQRKVSLRNSALSYRLPTTRQ